MAEEKQGFFQSELFKTGITILAILAIPLVAFGYSALTSDDPETDNEDNGVVETDENGENTTDNSDDSEGFDNGDESSTDQEGSVNGNGAQATKLPNTSSDEVVLVQAGDTLRDVVIKACGDSLVQLNMASNSDVALTPNTKVYISCK